MINGENEDNSILKNILTQLNIYGEIKDKKHPLVEFIKKNHTNLKKSEIKYSYTNAQTLWTEFKLEQDKTYLFRITKKIDEKTKELIKNEYKIHKENEELNNISPEFICYYFSNFLNFSVFIIRDYYTINQILKNIKLSKENSFLGFSIEDLLMACSETINSLQLDENYYICPFLTPFNLLYTESSGKEYFLLSEIFFVVDSKEKEIELELFNKDLKEWLIPEFAKNKYKLSFASNIYFLGKIFLSIYDNLSNSSLKLDDCPIYKKLIDNCLNVNINERWSIEEIQNYIKENNFEEIKVDNNKNKSFRINDSIISKIQMFDYNQKEENNSFLKDIEEFTGKEKKQSNCNTSPIKNMKNKLENIKTIKINEKSNSIENDSNKNELGSEKSDDSKLKEKDEINSKNSILIQEKENNKNQIIINNNDNNINFDNKNVIKEKLNDNTNENNKSKEIPLDIIKEEKDNNIKENNNI